MSGDPPEHSLNYAEACAGLGDDAVEEIRRTPRKPLTQEQIDYIAGLLRPGLHADEPETPAPADDHDVA